VLLLLLPAACSGDRESGRAPDFQVARFDGAEFQLSAQAGRSAVVLNFWYPTCPPCRAEMPAFENAWQQLRDEEVQFLGMFVPQGFDSEQDARDFVDELGLTYHFATDNGARIALSYELEYFPTTFFIDRSGRIFKRHIATLDEEGIVRIVREMAQG
jgi:peroxiredoxin